MDSWIYGSRAQKKYKFGVVRIYTEFIALRLDEIVTGMSVEEVKKTQGRSPGNHSVAIATSMETESRSGKRMEI